MQDHTATAADAGPDHLRADAVGVHHASVSNESAGKSCAVPILPGTGAFERPQGAAARRGLTRPASCGFKFITAATALTYKDPLFRAPYKGAPRFQAKLLIFKLIGPFLWCRPMMKMKLEGRGALL